MTDYFLLTPDLKNANTNKKLEINSEVNYLGQAVSSGLNSLQLEFPEKCESISPEPSPEPEPDPFPAAATYTIYFDNPSSDVTEPGTLTLSKISKLVGDPTDAYKPTNYSEPISPIIITRVNLEPAVTLDWSLAAVPNLIYPKPPSEPAAVALGRLTPSDTLIDDQYFYLQNISPLDSGSILLCNQYKDYIRNTSIDPGSFFSSFVGNWVPGVSPGPFPAAHNPFRSLYCQDFLINDYEPSGGAPYLPKTITVFYAEPQP